MEQTAVKVTTASALVATVPYLLGFAPTESVVLAGLTGPRSKIGFTLRADLPEPGESAEPYACALAARMTAAEIDRVLLFIYTEIPGVLPYRELVEDLQATLEVKEAFLVRGGRFWSFTCDEEACCPADGTALLDSDDEVGAIYALHNIGPVASREEVVAGLAAPTGDIATEFLAVRRYAPDAGGEDCAQLDRWLELFADPRAELTPGQLVGIVAVLDDVTVRDRWLTGLLEDDTTAMQSLLQYLIRHVPQGHDAAVSTLYGFAVYLRGEGLAATTAFARALATDVDYSLALLGLESLSRQISPAKIREFLAPLRDNDAGPSS